MDNVNTDSLTVRTVMVEPALAQANNEQVYQFEREGYFVADRFDHSAEKPVFNLTIGLREDKSLSQPTSEKE